ncbi:MAG: potassium channel protein [bacterium]
MKPLTHVRYGIITLLATIVVGTFGYHIVEPKMSLFDSFYMTIITISTTGFKEVTELSHGGRIITIMLIVFGVTAIAYTGGRAIQVLIEYSVFRRRRIMKKIEQLDNHYIVCGFGRMGRTISGELNDDNIPFVVIENNEANFERINAKDYLHIDGDATRDDVLIAAGIKKAKGLVAVVNTDAQNVFTTLSARQLNPKLFIVARAVEEETESKLIKAGADRVVLPYELGGSRMVQLLIRPGVMDFIDGVARGKGIDISLEEISLSPNSKLVGLSLADSVIRKELNIIIVAIHRADHTFIYNPQSSAIFEKDDKLIAIGESKNLQKLTELCLSKVGESTV